MKKLITIIAILISFSVSAQTLQTLQTQLKNAQASLILEQKKKNGNTAKYQAVIDKINKEIQALQPQPAPVIVTPPIRPVPPIITPLPVTNKAEYFNADLDDLKSLSAYTLGGMLIGQPCIQITDDPVYGAKRKVMKVDVFKDQNWGVTGNARAQVQTPMDYRDGQDVYIGFSVYFPQRIWTYFLTLSEIYGAPYQGTSPFRFTIQESNLVAMANDGKNETKLWYEPMKLNQWYNIVYHEVLSKDGTKGLIQCWLNRQGSNDYQEIIPPTYRATITAVNSVGPQYHKLAVYYSATDTYTDATKKVQVTDVTVYLTNHKVGSSFSQVAPTIIN